MAKRLKSKHTYEYKKLAKDSGSEDDGEEVDLFVRNKPLRKEIPTVDKEVEEGDTLQSLAIRYHCTIEDLKRLNNIHRENEIFAKRTIKVPHRPFTMALAGVHVSGSSSPEQESKVSEQISSDLINSKLNSTIINKSASGKVDEVNEIIFNSNIQKLEVVTSEPSVKDIKYGKKEEEVLLLPQQKQTVAEPVISKLNCNGADCDIPWIPLVIFILVGIAAVPIIYVFYIAEHLEDYHHQVNITNIKSKDVS